MQCSPVALFVYNRPQHTLQTLVALDANLLSKQTVLYIFADGPKDGVDDEQRTAIQKTREIIHSRAWCKQTIIQEQESNRGLASSIISGVTEVINKHGTVIVLEDDIVTNPNFLRYMNDGLRMYKDELSVASIHGYVYPVSKKLPDYFFIRGADCWGWATWKRAWDFFEIDGKKLLREIKQRNLERLFDFNGTYPYVKMLEDQITGRVSSWAIRWYASAFLRNMHTLYPGTTFVQNIGFDGSGTHCGSLDTVYQFPDRQYDGMVAISVEDNVVARRIFQEYFRPRKKILIKAIRKFLRTLRLR